MKKRLISLFVALTMLLCLIPAAFAATFNAGTYTASANGMNGAVTVEVTFSDSAITDVKVTEQAETPAIASGALEQIPADIVAHQTLAVDALQTCHARNILLDEKFLHVSFPFGW